ncbi:DUF3567 family protein [Niveibacterium sp. SC-1]|uniref:DUF3567 family protein n=1 Tax=Niveibacterium sp. SC-1 TaxID=3135646 RepID=UPI00311ED2D8
MKVMFNNPMLYVVSYPSLGIEVIDKRSGRGVFMRDETAERFTRELQDVIDSGDDETEELGDMIEHFDALMLHPAVYH